MRLLRARDHTTMPWRNGGGTTHEVARHPATGEADWRVSFADVTEPGPFSAFPGVDRVITLVDGERIDLTLGAGDTTRKQVLRPYEPFAFPGEEAVTCVPVGATRDLNLMTRREACRGAVECRRVSGTLDVEAPAGGLLLVAALSKGITCEITCSATTLDALDVVLLDPGERLALTGDGVVALLRVEPARAA